MRRPLPLLAALLLVSLAGCGQQADAPAPGTVAPVTTTAPAAVPAVTSPEAAAVATVRHWQCGDDAVALRHDQARDVLILTHARGELELPATPDADGLHADANGNAFRDGGDQAELTLSGQPPRACVAAEPAPGS